MPPTVAATFLRGSHLLPHLLVALFAALLVPAAALASDDEDLQTLQMFYDEQDLVVTAGRSAKHLSQTAENVTVVTVADIAAMGAHTVLEVLANVSGIQTDDRGSVVTYGAPTIHGAGFAHTLVLLDGVPQNFAADSSTEVSILPEQHIERIEIMKSPASSLWGSALGGVVNIVTKPPAEGRLFGGEAFGSLGEQRTRNTGGEVSGTAGPLGYYLFAGNLGSEGLQPHTAADYTNVYTKLRWNLPRQATLLFTLAVTKGSGGDGRVTAYDMMIDEGKRLLLATTSLNYPLTPRLDLDLSLHLIDRGGDTYLALGAVLSLDVDPADMGRQAAEMAARIASGTPANDIPHADARRLTAHPNIRIAGKLGVRLAVPGAGEAVGRIPALR